MNEITIALISGFCVAIPNVIATFVTNKKTTALLEYRLNELEKKVNTHNNLIDRMYKVETRVTLLEDEIKKEG